MTWTPFSSLARYLWVLPNSLLGAVFFPIALFPRGGFQVVEGVLEIHGPLIAWVLRRCIPMRGGALAITLGHVVLARDRQALAQTRAHERVHVRQCERWGPAFIPAYLAASLWAIATGRGAYDGNLFEREARGRLDSRASGR